VADNADFEIRVLWRPPGVPYFDVVFTVPDRLSGLFLGNRRVLYPLLQRSAWRALRRLLQV
jgi:hypothetical protein